MYFNGSEVREAGSPLFIYLFIQQIFADRLWRENPSKKCSRGVLPRGLRLKGSALNVPFSTGSWQAGRGVTKIIVDVY